MIKVLTLTLIRRAKMKAGRKPLPPGEKRRMFTVKLPPDIIRFLRQPRKESQADMIIKALRAKYPGITQK